MKTVTSQEVRRAAETAAAVTFTQSQKVDVANAVAQQHYRMRVLQVVVATAELLDSLAG